jgi:heme oxygenase (biliverdin-IX-beta and delta-forming)
MTPRTPLRWRLRDATASAHARLDHHLDAAFDTPAGYAAFLQGMHRFVSGACTALGNAPFAVASAQALRQDLRDLGLALRAPAAVARAAAAEAPGWQYVLAGSSLGARVLRPRAAALGFDAGHGARYLALQAESTAWRDVLAMLDAVPADAETAACEGALAAFALADACMRDALLAEAA